jgi:hypothetical protein
VGAAGQGAGWAGPYVTSIITEDTTRLLRDSFGNIYSYTTTPYKRTSDDKWVAARIRSLGPNRTDDGGTGDDTQVEILQRETLATVYGYVKDSSGTPITGATVTLYYPSDGSVASVSTTTTGGLYQFTNVPYGHRTLAISASLTGGGLKYVEGSALATGQKKKENNLTFNITNWGSSPVTVNSIRLDYNTSPQSFYEEAYVGDTEYTYVGDPMVFDHDYDYTSNCPDPNNPLCVNYNNGLRRRSGDTLTLPTPVTITIPGASGGASSVTKRIVVASDSVQVPDTIFYPTGGSTLNIRFKGFMNDQSKTKAKEVSIEGTEFTLYLNGSSTPFDDFIPIVPE